MFRSLFVALAFIASAASLSFGDDQIVIQDTPHDVPLMAEGEVPTQADAEHGVLMAEKRIVKLPQDANKFYCTIFGNKNDKKFNEIVAWFESNDQLKSMKGQTHWQKITTDMQIYGEHYAKTVPTLPCVRLQQANGKTLYQASGANIPATAESMGLAMSTEGLFRWRHRPGPNPSPDVDPTPNPDTDGDDEGTDDEPQEDVIKGGPVKPAPVDDHMQTLLGVMAAVGIGIAVGGAHAFVNNLQTYRANHH